ncbi:MAG: Asp-tRNA(Asn)/Glu-tRNA(Gln) amidotransferase subunit GatC [Proteobacteria bacterium]|nr:Asp-tRNA(Asn)/Glu-tRNA(Gln) amidotransferase subunit GatC [Pseudomonadota bacterium]
MKISAKEVQNVAELARLELDEALTAKLADQIGSILNYVDTLKKVDTTGVPPTNHALSLSNAFREDVVVPSPGTDKALANAPLKENGCFVVPKIVG